MIRKCSLYAACLLALQASTALADTTKSLGLMECYQLAELQSERLAISKNEIKIAEAQYNQAFAKILPHVSARATQRFRESTNSRSSFNSDGSLSDSATTSSRHPFQTALTLQQPIFSGFRDIFLFEAAKLEKAAREHESKRAADLLFLDVSEAFHQVSLYSQDLKVLADIENVLRQRIEELNRFIGLGRSRQSEALAAQADLDQVLSTQVETAKLLAATKEVLAFLTGVAAERLTIDQKPINWAPPSLETLSEQALLRADILAADSRFASGKKQVLAVERERWPSISLQGDYYPYQDPDNENDWDLLFRMEFPLFEGGEIDARIAEQRAVNFSQLLSLSEAKRSAQKEVRTAFANFQNSCKQTEVLKKLLTTSQQNLESQRKDYELGVVTNIEVLQAIQRTQDARRDLLEAKIECELNLSKLGVAAGSLP